MSGEAHFETYPQVTPAHDEVEGEPLVEPTGEFGWRLRGANGKIEAVGGEGFTRREDAHRAIVTVSQTLVDLALANPGRSAAPGYALDAACLPIVDLELDDGA
jgi:uncharacterized protein YegP (UPF0339 family)